MEFTELPADVQKIAAHTLHSILRDIGSEINSDQAKKLARIVKEAFIELHQTSGSIKEQKLIFRFDYAPCREIA